MGTSYISKVANNLIGKFDIHWIEGVRHPNEERSHFAFWLYESVHVKVRCEVKSMRPETLGRIAVHGLHELNPKVQIGGKTALSMVHSNYHIDPSYSGRDVLTEVATTAIIAEMADILRVEMERENSRQPTTSEGM